MSYVNSSIIIVSIDYPYLLSSWESFHIIPYDSGYNKTIYIATKNSFNANMGERETMDNVTINLFNSKI